MWAVLTVVATVLQIASWVWPTSRDWVDSHGLIFAATTCALLIVAVTRSGRVADPEIRTVQASGISERDRVILSELTQLLPPEFSNYLNSQRAENVQRNRDMLQAFAQRFRRTDHSHRLQNAYLDDRLEAFRLAAVRYTNRAPASHQKPEEQAAKLASPELAAAREQLKQIFDDFWAAARAFGF